MASHGDTTESLSLNESFPEKHGFTGYKSFKLGKPVVLFTAHYADCLIQEKVCEIKDQVRTRDERGQRAIKRGIPNN